MKISAFSLALPLFKNTNTQHNLYPLTTASRMLTGEFTDQLLHVNQGNKLNLTDYYMHAYRYV